MSEATFIPHPGSRSDHAARATEQATPASALGPVPVTLPAVPVTGTPRVAVGDTAVYRTMTLAPNTSPGYIRQLLPQDPQRYRATIVAVDNDVIVTDNRELAQAPDNTVASVPAPAGFYLPKGTPLQVANKALCWVVNTSSSATARVSVVIERYEDADPQ